MTSERIAETMGKQRYAVGSEDGYETFRWRRQARRYFEDRATQLQPGRAVVLSKWYPRRGEIKVLAEAATPEEEGQDG